MLKINDKELVYSTSFTLEPGERATLTPTELPGATIVIQTVVKASPSSEDIQIVTAGNTATVTVPFLQTSSLSTGVHLGEMRQGSIDGRLVGLSVVGGMLIHLDVYLSRTANFAPR